MSIVSSRGTFDLVEMFDRLNFVGIIILRQVPTQFVFTGLEKMFHFYRLTLTLTYYLKEKECLLFSIA